jgi:hypothetical protein
MNQISLNSGVEVFMNFAFRTLFVFVIATCAANAAAQQPVSKLVNQVAGESKNVIAIGQSISQSQEILRNQKIKFVEGGLALIKVEDQDNLLCFIDDNSTWVAIFYSLSKKTVTHISPIVFPSKAGHNKRDECWLSAKSIKFEEDGSYAIHFLPPVKEKPAEKPKDELPPIKNPPAIKPKK